MGLSLTVLIPAYNEEVVIEKTVLELKKYLDNLDCISSYEILVCINGSTDKTEEICHMLHLFDKKIKYLVTGNKGMGIALREGVKYATKDIITFVAADGEVLNDFIGRAVPLMTDTTFISGSRYLVKNQIRGSSFSRMFLSIAYAWFFRYFFFKNLTEVGTTKMFNRKWGQSILSQCTRDDASWQVEILYHAIKSGLVIKEIPINIKIKREPHLSKVNLIKEIYSFFTTTVRFGLKL